MHSLFFYNLNINKKFRWMDCVSITSSYFAYNIGYKYVIKYFDESTKEKVSCELKFFD